MDEELEQPVGGRLFSKHVPMVSTDVGNDTIRTVVHLVKEVIEPAAYTELITILDNATPNDVIIFNLNSPGGRLDSTVMIMDAMEHTEATTVGRITGDIASACTMIAMKVDNLEVAKWGSMMIHNYSNGLFGKGGEIKTQVAFEIPFLEKFFMDTYRPFLTKKECKIVVGDKDIYMDSTEIMQRWEAVELKRAKQELKAIAEADETNTQEIINYIETKGFKVKAPK